MPRQRVSPGQESIQGEELRESEKQQLTLKGSVSP